MMLLFSLLLGASTPVPSTAVGCTPQRPAAQVAGRASRYDSTSTVVGAAKVTVCYGRPKVNGRSIFGGLVPYDTLWRTGANEPTILHTDAAIEIAGLRLAAGSYSLYTVPRKNGAWTLVVNRGISQWGHESSYASVRSQEVGRRPITATQRPTSTETMTILASPSGLQLDWEKTRVTIPLKAAK